MSLPRFGAQCEPSWESFLGGKTPEPTHSGCPGGSNTPGLIGGWTCPCECHRAASQDEPSAEKQSHPDAMAVSAQTSEPCCMEGCEKPEYVWGACRKHWAEAISSD